MKIIGTILRHKIVLYCNNVTAGISRAINSILGGDSRETLSSRLGKKKVAGNLQWYWVPLYWTLNLIDPKHCENAIEYSYTNIGEWEL